MASPAKSCFMQRGLSFLSAQPLNFYQLTLQASSAKHYHHCIRIPDSVFLHRLTEKKFPICRSRFTETEPSASEPKFETHRKWLRSRNQPIHKIAANDVWAETHFSWNWSLNMGNGKARSFLWLGVHLQVKNSSSCHSVRNRRIFKNDFFIIFIMTLSNFSFIVKSSGYLV